MKQVVNGEHCVVRLPKVLTNMLGAPTNVGCFDNFVFNDNFTRNKILVRELQDQYQDARNRRQHEPSSLRKQWKNVEGCFSEEARTQCQGLLLTKKFQLDSIKRRDSKYRLETPLESAPERSQQSQQEVIDGKLNRLSQLIRKVSRSNFRQYMQENKPPAPNTMKLGLVNPRDRRLTRQQQYKLMRASNLLLLQDFKQELSMEEDYRKLQEARIKNSAEQFEVQLAPQEPQHREPSKEDADYLQDMQRELLSKMDFYVKRTIKDSGEYLIEPTLEEMHRNQLLKSIPTEERQQHVLFARTNLNLRFPTPEENNPLRKALELQKIMKMTDKRSSTQKAFFRAVQSCDTYDVTNMLKKEPQLIGSVDSKGNTVLHEAAKLGDSQLFSVLVQNGGRTLLSTKNNIGQTSIDLCRHFAHNHLLTLLKLS